MWCVSDYARPPLTMLRDSLGRRSKEYLRENSMPVVPYFIDPSRSIYERFIWFVIFAASQLAAIATMMSIWEIFQTSPTMTYLYIERENTPVDFPNVYVCYDEAHLNFSELSVNFQEKEETLRALYRWKGSFFDLKDLDGVPDKGYQEIFLQAAPECGEFFSNCKFGSKHINCSQLFANKTATPDGICCEFKSSPIEKDDPVWGLSFETNDYPLSLQITGKDEGALLYGQQPAVRMTEASSVDLSLDITFSADSVRFLSQTQRKCMFPDEGPSHVDCERRAIKRVMKSICKCLPWFYAENESEECLFSGYKCISDLRKEQLIEKNCYLSCEHTAYNVEKIERSAVFTTVRFLVWPEVRYRRVTRFGWLDLVVAFGGVAGFFLGYSIVANIELVYYFSLRTYCGAVLAVPKTKYNISPGALK